MLSSCLRQLDCLQAAEKPLVFIFTYLERHWIDRQIHEHRIDILPMKQLLWTRWDEEVLRAIWPSLATAIDIRMHATRIHAVELDGLGELTRLVHYIRVVSRPRTLDSDPSSTRRGPPSNILINSRAPQPDRFHDEFIPSYCEGLQRDLKEVLRESGAVTMDFVQQVKSPWT